MIRPEDLPQLDPPGGPPNPPPGLLNSVMANVRRRRKRRAGVALSAVVVLAIGSSVTALSLGGHGNKADQVATVVQTSPPPTSHPCPTSSPSTAATELGRATMNNRTRATLAAVALTSAVAACGTTTPKPTATPTAPGGATSTASTPASGPPATGALPTSTSAPSVTTSAPTSIPACASNTLSVSYDTKDGHAASERDYAPLVFSNRGSQPCTLAGYPGVSFAASKTGPQVGNAATRVSGGTAQSSGTVTPGSSSSALLGMDNSQGNVPGCQLAQVSGLRVYPPNQTVPLYVPFPTPQMQCVNSLSVGPLAAGVPNYG